MFISDSQTAEDFRMEVLAELDDRISRLRNTAKTAKPRRLAQINEAIGEISQSRWFFVEIKFRKGLPS